MSDKLNENGVNEIPEVNVDTNDAAEEFSYNPHDPKLEENDNWKFDGEALTLNDTVISDGELEIEIPKKAEKKADTLETRERPKAEKTATQPEKAAPKGDSRNSLTFFTVAVVMLILCGVLAFFGIRYYNTPNDEEIMNPGNVAVTIGDTDISLGMYNYYYNSVVNTYLNYAQYGQVELDTEKPYSEQETTDEDGNKITWEEKFKSDTNDQLQSLVAYYEGALNENITLTEEQRTTIDDDIDKVKQNADDADILLNDYISATYGNYCGINTLKKMEEWSYLAQNYLKRRSVDGAPTADEVDKYFEKNKDKYLEVPVAYLVIPFSDEATQAQAEKDAAEYAKNIKSVDDLKKYIPKAFKEIIDYYIQSGQFNTEEDCVKEIASKIEISVTKNEEGISDKILKWIFDEKNDVGAVSSFTDSQAKVVYVFYKAGKADYNKENVYSVRHILIAPEADDNGDSTKKQWKAAKKKADEVYEKFTSGDKSEYSFAELAEQYTADTSSTYAQSGTFGGLYTGVHKGDMVAEFEDWSLDKSRKYGDTGIVKTRFGYHIMFFIELSPSYLVNAKADAAAEKDEEYINSTKVKPHKHVMKKVKELTNVGVDDSAVAENALGTLDDDDTGELEEEEGGEEVSAGNEG